jgi:hypothetical protein
VPLLARTRHLPDLKLSNALKLGGLWISTTSRPLAPGTRHTPNQHHVPAHHLESSYRLGQGLHKRLQNLSFLLDATPATCPCQHSQWPT